MLGLAGRSVDGATCTNYDGESELLRYNCEVRHGLREVCSCIECGALVVEPETHCQWHRSIYDAAAECRRTKDDSFRDLKNMPGYYSGG